MKPSPTLPGVWVRVRASSASTFHGARGLVTELRAERRGAMVLLVGEHKPMFFGVSELELDTREVRS